MQDKFSSRAEFLCHSSISNFSIVETMIWKCTGSIEWPPANKHEVEGDNDFYDPVIDFVTLYDWNPINVTL